MKSPCLPKDCLYLVTDSDLLHSSAQSLEHHVEQAILGGVNVVQLREKEASTRDFVTKAKKLLTICKKHGVPLVINDRIDVALAIGADGVHIGQDDMSCIEARKLLGPNVFIGVSVNDLEEARQAVQDGADYLGIGAVYDTQTKALTKPTMGPSGVREVLLYLETVDRYVGTVAIGGLNAANIERVMFASSTPAGRKLDGVALVSAIMTSSAPEHAARGLKGLLTATPAFSRDQKSFDTLNTQSLDLIATMITRIRKARPLIQHMTNNVVKNFSANVTIAIGGSPAMSEVEAEVDDFANSNGALLVNMGMVNSITTSIAAVQANNARGNPCLFDPVGAGATAFRRAATRRYLDNGFFDVVKGNEGEIRAAAGLTSDQKGVDNGTSSSIDERVRLARDLARNLHNIVVITGVEDIISNGRSTVIVRSGHPWLGEVTGSGCSLGSVIASALAVNRDDKLLAVVAAVSLYGLAAQHAASKKEVQGPGTFLPAFVDSLYTLSTNKDLFRAEMDACPQLLKIM